MKNIYNKYQEFINYGFFGFITTLLHILLFWLLIKLGLKYYVSNIITLVIVKTVAYIVNKIFVFKTKCKNNKELSNEIFKYIVTRLFTMVIDYFGLILLVEKFNINELIGKGIVLVIVVIINYFLCKKYVYKNNDKKNKLLEFTKKHWFILLILLFSIIRFFLSYDLPNFFLDRLNYDDGLYVRQSSALMNGTYLGSFTTKTLIKGPIFSYLLYIINLYNLTPSLVLTLLYIFVCIYFIYSLENIIDNRKYLIIVFIVLLFNPVTYSQDLFQRLYRNSISIIELLFFLGSLINVLFSKYKYKLYNLILYGLSLSLLWLTREDILWVYPAILFVIIFNFLSNKKLKILLMNLIPVLLLFINLNIISYINYKHYNIYTYNEISKSEFHNTYKKVLQIKDEYKYDQVSVPKSTLYLLSEKTKSFGLTKTDIDMFYNKYAGEDGEIYNGNMIWYFRSLVYRKYKFKNGKESEEYYKKLGNEIDRLFKEGKLEKEFTMPSLSLTVPTKNNLIDLPYNIVEAITYTTTYEDIKVLTDTRDYSYDKNKKAYYFAYRDYHHTVNIVKKNPLKYEIIRVIYCYSSIVLSLLSYTLYLINTGKKDRIAIFSHILFLFYVLIIGGVSYTHITMFHAIRPLYLANVYILQTIFIFINLYRLKDIKKTSNSR